MIYVIKNKYQILTNGLFKVTHEDIILTTINEELLFNTIDKIKKIKPNKNKISDIYIVYGFDIMESANLDAPKKDMDYIIYSFDNTYKK